MASSGGLLILLLSVGAATQSPAVHDKAFWRAVAANKFAPPAAEPLPPLVAELSGYLASPDPELRDDIAYSTLASWIYRQRIVPVDARRALLGEWSRNLTQGIGERGTSSVFRRSFSALALGVLVITDNEAPYLDKQEFDRLLAAAVTYLRDEKDTRGFDPTLGWMHSVAHTADLLKFLARSRHLQPVQQTLILQAIASKIGNVEGVLTHGEDERLARAVLSIVAREDFDAAGFRQWAASLAPPRATGAPTAASLATAQNRRNLAVSLYAVLSTDARNLPVVQAARDVVLGVLRTMM